MKTADKILMGLGVSMSKALRESFNRVTRYADICNHSLIMFWRNRRKVLERNNRRKMNGKPMIRIKSYEKAFRNRRKNYGSSRSQ